MKLQEGAVVRMKKDWVKLALMLGAVTIIGLAVNVFTRSEHQESLAFSQPSTSCNEDCLIHANDQKT